MRIGLWDGTDVGYRIQLLMVSRSSVPRGEADSRAARQRDEQILSIAKQHAPEIKIIIKDGHNLLDPELVVKKGNNGKCISTLVAWKKVSLYFWGVKRD